jgi:P27 family predicted phage terminase small subunit
MVLLVVPLPTKDYSERVVKTWNKIATELLDAGILYALDIGLIEQYCDIQEQYFKCLDEVNTNGVQVINRFGDSITNPSLIQLQSITKVMPSIGANLGLGPANRTKIGGHVKKGEKDGLMDFLNKKPQK